jgi:hypothetical protein
MSQPDVGAPVEKEANARGERNVGDVLVFRLVDNPARAPGKQHPERDSSSSSRRVVAIQTV